VNLGYDISQRLQQQQKLTSQMIQSLKLLQVSTLQLEEMLKIEMEQNPVLEIDEYTDTELEIEERRDEEDERERNDSEEYLDELGGGEDGIDWEEYLEEGFDLGYSFNEEADPNAERYEQESVYEETLEEHLTKQLSEKKLGGRQRLLIEFLIGCLDDDGYLSLPVSEIAETAQATVYEVEEALNVLWQLDPAGIGARDLRECMILQLRARGLHTSPAMAIVTGYWGLLEKLRIPEISKQLGVEPREVQEALNILKTLNPSPGSQYTGKSSTIIPDLVVKKVDGKFITTLNDNTVPTLRINKTYENMVRRGSKAKSDAKEYIRERLARANLFIDSIEQRRRTMLKVMNAIIERQKTFFEEGPPNLKPLKMEEVAEKIEMHLSTVSRVASGKYVQTPHGIFELRYFFTAAVGLRGPGDSGVSEDSETGGADITAERVRNRIRQIIDDEDPKQPVSDQKIAEILEKENLPAARRTVAKYREQMKILAARMRQKYD